MRIVNNAKIISATGRVDLEDALWGAWTYEHLKRRLVRLSAKPANEISLSSIRDSPVLCDSYAQPVADPQLDPAKKK